MQPLNNEHIWDVCSSLLSEVVPLLRGHMYTFKACFFKCTTTTQEKKAMPIYVQSIRSGTYSDHVDKKNG